MENPSLHHPVLGARLFHASFCTGFLGLIEAFLEHSGQVREQPAALTGVGRAVHDSERFRFQLGQRAQELTDKELLFCRSAGY
jgi:hypothetical protein